MKSLACAALTCALLVLVSGPLVAQIRVGGGDRPEREGPAAPQELNEAQSKWVRTLASQLANEDPLIARSAGAAVAAVGRPALPLLEELSRSDDEKLAAAAKRLHDRIARSRDRGDRGDRRGRGSMTDRLVEGLDLDEKQRAAVDAAMEAQGQAMRDIFRRARSGEIDRQEARELMQAAREEAMKGLEGALPAEKISTLKERMGRGSGRGGRGGGGGRRRGGDG